MERDMRKCDGRHGEDWALSQAETGEAQHLFCIVDYSQESSDDHAPIEQPGPNRDIQ